MPETLTTQRLRGLVLSASELKAMTQGRWPDALIEDYLNFLDNFITIANLLDIEIDQKVEEIPTNLPEDELIAPKDGFLVSTGQTVSDIESRSFFFARIY